MFEDRYDAARQLAERLKDYKDNKEAVLVTIPRGGLEIGVILAEELNLPLDIVLTKKIGAPDNPEFAIGAVSLDQVIIDPQFDIPELQDYFAKKIQELRAMLTERLRTYKGDEGLLPLKDKIVILTDDGIATGKTMLLALQTLKKQGPKKIIVALPVAPPDSLRPLQKQADEVICLNVASPFFGVGAFYREFRQVSDEEARALLQRANQ